MQNILWNYEMNEKMLQSDKDQIILGLGKIVTREMHSNLVTKVYFLVEKVKLREMLIIKQASTPLPFLIYVLSSL